LPSAWINFGGVIIGALLTSIFLWLTARSAKRRTTIATNSEQDRLRMLDLYNQVSAENARLIKRADRADTLVDTLHAELDFAHAEIRRLNEAS
jgi:type II secretory pathway pseudopilin PulG